MLIGIIVIIVFGIMPGLGSIIGTGEHERAIRLRNEINSLIWLVATALGASILIWNRVFITLWVGSEHYSGILPNLLIVAAAMQLVFIRSDGNIIDLTLRLSQKVLLGFLSVMVSVGFASFLVGYLKLGIIGLCIGIMSGRLIISLGYPILIGRFLGINPARQFQGIVRPVIVTICLFLGATSVESLIGHLAWGGLRGWLVFVFSAGMTSALLLLISFYAGLSNSQRTSIVRRIRVIISNSESSQSVQREN
jgi:hypothetical protein